jgi:hypothetical protein
LCVAKVHPAPFPSIQPPRVVPVRDPHRLLVQSGLGSISVEDRQVLLREQASDRSHEQKLGAVARPAERRPVELQGHQRRGDVAGDTRPVRRVGGTVRVDGPEARIVADVAPVLVEDPAGDRGEDPKLLGTIVGRDGVRRPDLIDDQPAHGDRHRDGQHACLDPLVTALSVPATDELVEGDPRRRQALQLAFQRAPVLTHGRAPWHPSARLGPSSSTTGLSSLGPRASARPRRPGSRAGRSARAPLAACG